MRATQVFLVVAVVVCAAVLLEAKPASKKNSHHTHKCKSNADCQKACSGHGGTCDAAKKLCVCDAKGGKQHTTHKHPATKPSKVNAKAAAPATAPPAEGPANPSIPAEEAEAATAPSAEDGANPSIPAMNPSIPAEEAEAATAPTSEA